MASALAPAFRRWKSTENIYLGRRSGLEYYTPLTKSFGNAAQERAWVSPRSTCGAQEERSPAISSISPKGKDIQYASRTRAITAFVSQSQNNARLIKETA